jgi:hypothetical protein
MHAQDVPAVAAPNFIEKNPVAVDVAVSAENFRRLSLHASLS